MENVSVRGRGKSTYKYRYSRTDSVPRESYSPQESERKASGVGKKGCQSKVWPKSWHFLVIQLQIHPGLSGGSIGSVGRGNGNGARPAIELYLMHIRCSMSESLKPKADKSPPIPACLRRMWSMTSKCSRGRRQEAAVATASTAAEGIEFSVGQLSLSGKRMRVNAAKSKGNTTQHTNKTAYIMLSIYIYSIYICMDHMYVRDTHR